MVVSFYISIMLKFLYKSHVNKILEKIDSSNTLSCTATNARTEIRSIK